MRHTRFLYAQDNSHMDSRARCLLVTAHWLAERRHSGAHALHHLRVADGNGCHCVDCDPLTTARRKHSGLAKSKSTTLAPCYTSVIEMHKETYLAGQDCKGSTVLGSGACSAGTMIKSTLSSAWCDGQCQSCCRYYAGSVTPCRTLQYATKWLQLQVPDRQLLGTACVLQF